MLQESVPKISLHRNLEQLQRYLELSDEQVLGAAASLAMLSPVAANDVNGTLVRI
ncbi:MAG: hypothetical protein V7L23_13860 [Nostoc sp.]|uniref:hypothetical protein n=1 Tax=Nostoc sp. TaxID=1180 RepID=UPI002FEF93C3